MLKIIDDICFQIRMKLIKLPGSIIYLSMKQSQTSSFYMGLTYKPAHRPSCNQFFFSHSASTDSQYDPEQHNIIHKVKSKRKVKQIIQNCNPYLVRKESQLRERKKREKTNQLEAGIQSAKGQFFHVKKIPTTIGVDQCAKNAEPINQEIVVSVPLVCSNRYKKKDAQKQLASSMSQRKKIDTEPIFSHFPANLFVETQKYKILESKKAVKNMSSLFFPSKRVKTEGFDSAQQFQADRNRKICCSTGKPRKKLSQDTRVFNFDGTLQNYRITIPERPKTADNRIYGKFFEKKKNMKFLSYNEIANRCIKLKKSKVQERGPGIVPWIDDQSSNNADPFDISCSSIRLYEKDKEREREREKYEHL